MTGRDESNGSKRRSRWFYALCGALALTGAGLLFASAGPRAGSVSTAGAGSSGSLHRPAANAAGGSAAFPAGSDTLGISRGPRDAPVVVREFGDYQCPACGSFYPTGRKIEDTYVKTGRVRFVFFDFPIVSVHPNALAAAQAARCAGRQGTYWAMHDRLFEKQSTWSDLEDPVPAFGRYAEAIGIDPQRLVRCVRSGSTRAAVERSMRFGMSLGVRSTPTIVVGNTGIAGAVDWPRMREMIERRLDAVAGGSGSGTPDGGPGRRPAGPGGRP
ncbi:MAG TPA: thioredoxin domain-containing protein [Gemmatimonadota bacterium]|nr:thioredoxin domain-containing protein [Gemmatimonadota bacterium]